VSLAGGPERLLSRIQALTGDGRARLAAPLAEWAVTAQPGSQQAHKARAAVSEALAATAPSLMSRGIYGWAARTAAERTTEHEAGGR
jgi:alkyl sulfatase BDS1-like metallo-beta-lactamase superfamily hydrolase